MRSAQNSVSASLLFWSCVQSRETFFRLVFNYIFSICRCYLFSFFFTKYVKDMHIMPFILKLTNPIPPTRKYDKYSLNYFFFKFFCRIIQTTKPFLLYCIQNALYRNRVTLQPFLHKSPALVCSHTTIQPELNWPEWK